MVGLKDRDCNARDTDCETPPEVQNSTRETVEREAKDSPDEESEAPYSKATSRIPC